MTAATRTEITNLALREIGATRIEDWNDLDPSAIVARDVWDQARRTALGRHSWQFAMKGVELSRASVTPPTRYLYRYTLPGDFVRLDAAADNDRMDPVLDEFDGFVQRDGSIDANAERVWVEYVYDAPSIGAWPPWFCGVMAADLAALMSGPLKSTAERERLEQLADKRLKSGMSTDSIQQAARQRKAGGWRRAARGSWRG